MAIYKNKDIEVNVNEKSVDVGFIDTNFYTEDKSTSSIRITIKNNKRAVDLTKTNLTPKLDLFHSDGSIFMDENINIVLPEQGIIQYKISDQVIKHPGKVNAKLFLKNKTQSVHVANFNFTIKDSGITEAVSKEITVNIVDDSVRRIINENAIELLGAGFKDDVTVELKDYVTSNAELFKGPKGDKGDVGPKGVRGYQGPVGSDGLSAYELALMNGFEGSEKDWLNSLKAEVTDQQLQDIKEQIVNSTIPPSIIDVPTCASRNRANLNDLRGLNRGLNDYGLKFTSFTDGYITSFEVFSETDGIIEFYLTDYKGASVPASKEYKRIKTKLKAGWNTIDFIGKIESNKEYCIAVNFIDNSSLAVGTAGSYDEANIQNTHLVKPDRVYNPLTGGTGTAYLFIFNIKVATDTNSRLLLNQITSSTY